MIVSRTCPYCGALLLDRGDSHERPCSTCDAPSPLRAVPQVTRRLLVDRIETVDVALGVL